MSIARIEASLDSDDSFSAPVRLRGRFNFVLDGAFEATVSLQRSFQAPTGTPDWHDVPDEYGATGFAAPTVKLGEEPEGAWYRFGIKAGDHVSGTVSGRLSQ